MAKDSNFINLGFSYAWCPRSFCLLQSLIGSKYPNRNSPLSSHLNARIWGLNFHRTSQIYEKVCLSLEPEVSAGKTRLRWQCVSRPVRFLFECADGLELRS